MNVKLCWEGFVIAVMIVVTSALNINFEYDDEFEPSYSRCSISIKTMLRNGRVKLRSRGRIAKFICNSGFDLAGKRFATCVRGEWNNPVPVCVARGCPKKQAPANGKITEMYRGALLMYECLPGYVIEGPNSLYCDGRFWSEGTPLCKVATENPMISCDFEDPDLCGWSHDPTHDFDWKRNQFSTPSGHVGTGPSYDHTFGKGRGGFYLYVEASSPRKENDTARLFSPVFNSGFSGGCFVFWYHMYGSTTGGLKVYVKPESHVFGELAPSWWKYGDQGNQWFRGNLSIPTFTENFQVIIEALRGSGYVADSAIDDVSLSPGDCDSINGNGTSEAVEDVETYSCRGRCGEYNDPGSCGCSDNCYTNQTCCSDYSKLCESGKNTTDDEDNEEVLTPIEPTSSPTSEIPESIITSSVSDDISGQSSTYSSSTTLTELTTEEYNRSSPNSTTAEISSTGSLTTGSPSQTFSPSARISSIRIVTETQSTATAVVTALSTPLTTTLSSPTTKQLTTLPSTTTQTTTTAAPSSTTTKLITSAMRSTTVQPTSTVQPTILTTKQLPTTAVQRTTAEASTTSAVTRRTYNLRPRTTPMLSTTSNTTPATSKDTPTPSQTTPKTPTISRNSGVDGTTAADIIPTTTRITAKLPTTIEERWWFPPSVITSTTTQPPPTTITTPRTSPTTTTMSTTTRSTTTTSTSRPRVTTYTVTTTPRKVADSTTASTTLFVHVTESHSSRSASPEENTNSSVATSVSISLVLFILSAVGLGYVLHRRRSKSRSRLSDDSELRFLSETEGMDYSDPSSLDRMLVN